MGLKLLDLLLPRETKFFDYLDEMSGYLFDGCSAFHDLAVQIENLSKEELRKRLYCIKDIELKGDKIELVIIDELHRCFITPLDREDIHALAGALERPLNTLKDLSSKIEIYRIDELPVNACRFAEIMLEEAKLQRDVVRSLRGRDQVQAKLERMHELENQADELFHESLEELFRKSKKSLTAKTLKLKEVYEMQEEIVDAIDDIGKLIRGIKIKNG